MRNSVICVFSDVDAFIVGSHYRFLPVEPQDDVFIEGRVVDKEGERWFATKVGNNVTLDGLETAFLEESDNG